MTLQQLKYADRVAATGSISEAARQVFVTQPTLTEAIRALEEELRVAIFTRSSRGVSVTREGEEFLASARQILDDAARIQEKYTGKAVRRPQFAVSCQHYAFAVVAFMDVVRSCEADRYDFTLRETVTSEIIDDVARHRSEIGILYLSRRNERAITKILHREELSFEELFVAKPHVFLGKRHPLAKKKITERHGRAILTLKPDQQKKALDYIVNNNLTVKDTEKYIERYYTLNPDNQKDFIKCFGVSTRIAVNTIRQAVNSLRKVNMDIDVTEQDNPDDYVITISIKK